MAGFINTSLPVSSDGYYLLAGDLKLPVEAQPSDNNYLYMHKGSTGNLKCRDKMTLIGTLSIQIPDIHRSLTSDKYSIIGSFTHQMPIDVPYEMISDTYSIIGSFLYQCPINEPLRVASDSYSILATNVNVAYFPTTLNVIVSRNPFGD